MGDNAPQNKKKDRLTAVLPSHKLADDQAGARAALFLRFLRQPSRPNPPRPETNSGRVAGSGVAAMSLIAPVTNKDPLPESELLL